MCNPGAEGGEWRGYAWLSRKLLETRYWSPRFLGSLNVQAGPAMQYPAEKERLMVPGKSRTVDGRNPQDHDRNVGPGGVYE